MQKQVLLVINGNPLLGDLEEIELSDQGFESIKSINEIVRYDDDSDYFSFLGEHAGQVLEYSVKTLMECELPSTVQTIVEKFGVKHFFSEDFSEMIDNLGKQHD